MRKKGGKSVIHGPLSSSGGGALAFKWNDPIFRSKLLDYTYGSKNLAFWLVTLLSLIDCPKY